MNKQSSDDSTLILCEGPSSEKCHCQCPTGPCEHKWDGPDYIELDNTGLHISITCSRCGMLAIDHDKWVF